MTVQGRVTPSASPTPPPTAPPLPDRSPPRSAWVPVLLLGVALWLPLLGPWLETWRADPIFAHGPVVVALALGALWLRRDAFRGWSAARAPGLLIAALGALVYIAAFYADLTFFKFLGVMAITLGTVWFLGGGAKLRAAAGPMGFLLFAIPWPTSLIERVAFPLQLMSSRYAAMLGGIAGLNVHREGIALSVVSPAGTPIYSVLVAQACSGITSLMVLLALAYLVASITPVRWRYQALLMLLIIPVALAANAVRLVFILLAGTYHGAALAQWVHDNEAPPLIFLCTLGLLGLRTLLLRYAPLAAPAGPGPAAQETEAHAR